ncbi:hypothetical protein DRE_04183 [Drechslerella stenobrocha 248]|uniref:Uncharacterized protein n=1 Tax=Drechslerella stenobrocha 248 TaxID=1043628 RepID=W7HRM7_9PEZI|nr:hypothetical protein DRE_04183 [Drechslerella stenobrocha 248]
MRTAVVFAAFAASVLAVPTNQGCNANNCLRAVRKTNLPEASDTRTADCNSYLSTTVTPATVTETSTIHVIETTHVNADTTTTVDLTVTTTETKKKRDVTVTPTVTPTYATACSGVDAYISACLCIGATGTAITVAAPTTVTTSTIVDSTTTITDFTGTVTATALRLRFTDAVSSFSGAYVASKTISGQSFIVPTTVPASAALVVLQPDQSVTYGDKLLVGKQSTITTDAKYLVFIEPATFDPSIHSAVTCQIAADYKFTCITATFVEFGVYIGSDHKDTLRLFKAGFSYNSNYKGNLHLEAINPYDNSI